MVGISKGYGRDASIDQVGNKLLPKAIDGDVSYGLWPRHWVQLKTEFRSFLCTKDKKYTTLRKQLATSKDKSQTAIVSMISAAMAVHFGVATGVLVPFCAMCLVVLVRVGTEAFCSSSEWNMRLSSGKPNSNS